jgi:hypothetical protein
MTRVEELTLRLADGELSDREFEELERLVLRDPAAARTHLALLDLEAELRTQTEEPGLSHQTMQRLRATLHLKTAVMDQIRNQVESEGRTKRGFRDPVPPGAPEPSRQAAAGDSRRAEPAALKRTTSARALLGVPAGAGRSWGWPGLLAAGFLAALFMLFALGPQEPNAAKTESQKWARASREAEARRAAEREEEAAARRRASALEMRRAGEERLKEIQRRQAELARSAGQPGQDPGEQEKRKAEERKLASDKDAIEKELAEAIKLAPGAPGPAATGRPKEESPELPQKPPKGQEAPQGTESMVATVERVEGSAAIVGKEERIPAQARQGVPAGQGVETGAKSSLVLKYPDGTRLELGGETVLRQLIDEGGKRLRVEKGAVKAQVAKQQKDQPMIFATPYGEAKVLGTILRLFVDLDPRKGTRLEVEEGKVELKNLAGKAALIEGGHFAVAAAGTDLTTGSDPSAQIPRKGLAFWVRADQGVTLRDSAVSAWADLSGNNRHAVQPVPAQQPTFVPRAIGGHPAIRFDGVDDCLTFPCPVTRLAGMSIFLVAATAEERTGGITQAGNAALCWKELENYGVVFLTPFQTKVHFGFGTGQPPCVHVYPRTATLDRGYSVTTAIKSLANVVLFVNGRECLRASGDNRPIAKVEDLGAIGLGMGDRATHRRFPGEVEGESYFPGEIAEILVYSRALGDAERKAVEQVLLGKYMSK